MTDVDPFMIRAHVPDWDACVADYRAASEKTRLAHPDMLTVRYGDGVDESLDLFVPPGSGRDQPVHLFVHGGYWRAFSKADYGFVADAILKAGALAAIMDYSLMPAARMERLVDQVRRAAFWLSANAERFGGDPTRLSASGHSAGAHLSSFLVCRGRHEPDVPLPPVGSALLVSGLYDLAPITRSFVQPEIRLTPDEVDRWSPMHATPAPDATVTLLVGEAETTPFHEQATRFAGHLARGGARVRLATVSGEDHMTIVRELGRPGTATGRFIAEAVAPAA